MTVMRTVMLIATLVGTLIVMQVVSSQSSYRHGHRSGVHEHNVVSRMWLPGVAWRAAHPDGLNKPSRYDSNPNSKPTPTYT